MSGEERFSKGERVSVEIDGRAVDCVFVRYADQPQVVDVQSAAASGDRPARVGWVRRSDSGEVEPFAIELISAA